MTARPEATFSGNVFQSLIPSNCTHSLYFGGSEQTPCNNEDKTHYTLDFIQCYFITQLNTAQLSHRTKVSLWLLTEWKNRWLFTWKTDQIFWHACFINSCRVIARLRHSNRVYIYIYIIFIFFPGCRNTYIHEQLNPSEIFKDKVKV